MPIQERNYNGRKAYSLTDVAVALLIGRLRDYEISLTSWRRLLERIDRNLLRDHVDRSAANEIDDVIVLIPFTVKFAWRVSDPHRLSSLEHNWASTNILSHQKII